VLHLSKTTDSSFFSFLLPRNFLHRHAFRLAELQKVQVHQQSLKPLPTMLVTIDEKLSAIKAINEEKESVDTTLNLINAIQATGVDPLHNYTLHYYYYGRSGEGNHISILNPAAILDVIKSQFETRQQELIAKATELMK
jgi:hypothetical protein